jgi:hypothetical protein
MGKWESKNYQKKGIEMQFVGWSFPSQHYRYDPFLTFNKDIIDPNLPVLGLLHGEVENLESLYAPINSGDLLNSQVDTWILGHIHKPWVIRDSSPYICYPGSPHAMSAKETGMHGLVLITIEGKERGKIENITFSPVRFETLDINISEDVDESALRSIITSNLVDYGAEITTELDEVLFLVCDLVFNGEHNRIQEFESWLKNLGELSLVTETTTKIVVRKTTVKLTPKIDLEDLAKQPSPAGILAQAIIALENNRSTPFLDRLKEKWQDKQIRINNANTYQPLRPAGMLPDNDVKEYILQECNRLMSELNLQQA